LGDGSENGREILLDFLILEAEDLETVGPEPTVSFGVLGIVQVMQPIDLDNQFLLQAGEVSDEGANGHLTSEVIPHAPVPPQLLPEHLLRRRHATPELPRHLW
jgi:hypothetical protein